MTVVVKSYPVEVRRYKIRASGEYFEFPIPDELVEEFDWQVGENIVLSRQFEETSDGGRIVYIEASPGPDSARNSYELKERPDLNPSYSVAIPSGWVTTQKDFKTGGKSVQNPFYQNIDHGTKVVVEEDASEDSVRIYDQDDHAQKYGVEIRNPVVTALAGLAASFLLDREFVAISDLPDETAVGEKVAIEGEARVENLKEIIIGVQDSRANHQEGVWPRVDGRKVEQDHCKISTEYRLTWPGEHDFIVRAKFDGGYEISEIQTVEAIES